MIAAYSKTTPFSFGARFRQLSIALYSRTRKPSGSNRRLALSVTPPNGKQLFEDLPGGKRPWRDSSKAVLSRHGTISLYPRLHRLCRRRINADHPSRKQRLAAFAESIGPLLRHPHTIRYAKNNVAGSSGPAIGTISKRRDDSQRFPRHQVTLSSPSETNTHDCIYDCINKSPSGSSESRWASRWHCGQRKSAIDFERLQLTRFSKRFSFCFGCHENRKHQTKQKQARSRQHSRSNAKRAKHYWQTIRCRNSSKSRDGN